MPCRRAVIRVGSDLFLIYCLTSVFLSFSTCHPLFCTEICEACLPLCGHIFWVRRVLTMTPGFLITFLMGSSVSARSVAHLERLPGALDVAYGSVSQYTFFCSVFLECLFFHRFSRGVCRYPLLWILPALWIFCFHVGVFFLSLLAHF